MSAAVSKWKKKVGLLALIVVVGVAMSLYIHRKKINSEVAPDAAPETRPRRRKRVREVAAVSKRVRRPAPPPPEPVSESSDLSSSDSEPDSPAPQKGIPDDLYASKNEVPKNTRSDMAVAPESSRTASIPLRKVTKKSKLDSEIVQSPPPPEIDGKLIA